MSQNNFTYLFRSVFSFLGENRFTFLFGSLLLTIGGGELLAELKMSWGLNLLIMMNLLVLLSVGQEGIGKSHLDINGRKEK